MKVMMIAMTGWMVGCKPMPVGSSLLVDDAFVPAAPTQGRESMAYGLEGGATNPTSDSQNAKSSTTTTPAPSTIQPTAVTWTTAKELFGADGARYTPTENKGFWKHPTTPNLYWSSQNGDEKFVQTSDLTTYLGAASAPGAMPKDTIEWPAKKDPNGKGWAVTENKWNSQAFQPTGIGYFSLINQQTAKGGQQNTQATAQTTSGQNNSNVLWFNTKGAVNNVNPILSNTSQSNQLGPVLPKKTAMDPFYKQQPSNWTYGTSQSQISMKNIPQVYDDKTLDLFNTLSALLQQQ